MTQCTKLGKMAAKGTRSILGRFWVIFHGEVRSEQCRQCSDSFRARSEHFLNLTSQQCGLSVMAEEEVDRLLAEQLATVARMLETRRNVGALLRDVRESGE